MRHILAEIPSVPLQIAGWLGCLAFAVGLLNGLIKLKDNLFGKKGHTEISPQPLEVRESHDFARERDCLSRSQAMERTIAEMRRGREEDLRIAGASRRTVYEKIEKEIKENRAHVEAVRAELTEKIDEMPNRLVALLKNTGAIG